MLLQSENYVFVVVVFYRLYSHEAWLKDLHSAINISISHVSIPGNLATIVMEFSKV